MRGRDKGFTLIELIVTVAIIAIFSGVVLTFVGTGAHSYRSTSGNAKVQMETQDVMDQIQNIIIDVNRSVYYSYGDGMNENVGELVLNDVDSYGDATAKTFFACSGTATDHFDDEGNRLYNYNCDVILWNKQDQKLYYARRDWEGIETEKNKTAKLPDSNSWINDSGAIVENKSVNNESTDKVHDNTEILDITDNDIEVADDVSAGENNGIIVSTRTSEIEKKVEQTLLAENITDFRVDVSKAVSERIVRFQFTANFNGKETTTIHTVNLRNQIQVSKPEDGYTKSDTATPWILLTNYPAEVEPGKSVTGFTKLINGNIDPDTVKWVVESGRGEFIAGAEGANDFEVTLKAEDDAKEGDIITIHVEAKTINGKTVTSKTGTIKVANKKVPVELVPNTEQLLLGVGNSYALSDLIKWKIKYSDESQKELSENQVVVWELENLPEDNGISLGSTTAQLTIPRNNLGSDALNSVFSIKATMQISGKTLTGKITVKLARIDILSSKDEYEVSEQKPQYEYREGGVVVENPSYLNFECTHNNKKVELGTYKIAENFVQNDVGNWILNVSVKVGEKTVSDKKIFSVKSKPVECEMGGRDIIIANQTYLCSYWKHNNFHPNFTLKENQTWDYEITWQITGESDSNTAFPDGVKSIVNNEVNLIVGSQEHGFVLEAFVKVFDRDTKIVAETYHASKNIRVITQSDVIMENPIDIETNQAVENYTVEKGRNYRYSWSLYIWQYNSTSGKHYRTKIDSLTENNITWSNEKGWWNADIKEWEVPLKTDISSLQLTMYVTINDNDSALGGKNIMPPNIWYRFEIPKTINIKDPETTIELLDDEKNTSSEIFPDDKVVLTAYTIANNKEFVPDHWRWKWECLDMDTKQLVKDALHTVDNNINNKFIFTAPSILNQTTNKQYKITASYALYDNDTVERKASYIVTVKPYTVTAKILAVDNKTSIFPGDITQLYLKLQNEKSRIDGSVKWSCNNQVVSISPSEQNSVYSNGKEELVTVTANGQNISSSQEIIVTATYKIKGSEKEDSTTIKLLVTPLMMNLVHENDELYYNNSDVTEKILVNIIDAADENGKEVTSEYDIEWSVSPATDNNLNTIYTFTSDKNQAILTLTGKPESTRTLMITATAKKNGNIACFKTTSIKINSKYTKTISYMLSENKSQMLCEKMDSADKKLDIQEITAGYMQNGENIHTECDVNKLPTLILTGDKVENLKVEMNDTSDDFNSYKYIIISVDLKSVLYNIYIYPIKNNVYDEKGEAITYVPTDLDTIRKWSHIGEKEGDDNKNYPKGYTFTFTDIYGETCLLRQSIHKKTGIGSMASIMQSSIGKWFMYRDSHFYRLDNGEWRLFHDGMSNNIINESKYTYYYWNLVKSIWLLGDGIYPPKNIRFWQKWN